VDLNRNWTKQDNDKMRELIKEGKDSDFIRNYFGNNKLFYHPNKKYYIAPKSSILPNFKKKISDFNGFINEIKYEELKTDFKLDFNNSEQFIGKFNYLYTFQTNSGNRYVVDFIYLSDDKSPYPNRDIYNMSFTLEKNRNLDDYKDYEKPSQLNEEHEVIKRVLFIINDFLNNKGSNSIILIGETEDKRKINWYRNLIKQSIPNIKETEGISSFTNGLKAYYYDL